MTTPHPEFETLAELADPAAVPTEPVGPEDAAIAEVLAHVADCPTCQADLAALRNVRETLRGLPPVPMPADVAERIEAALLAARTADNPPADVVPIKARAVSQPRQRNPFPYGAAAAVVAVLAIGGGVVFGLSQIGGDTKKSAASAAASSRGPLLVASGTDYTTDALRSQVAAVVNGRVPTAAADFPGLADPNVLSQGGGVAAGASASGSAPAAAAAGSSSAAAAPATASTAPSPFGTFNSADSAGSDAHAPPLRRTAPAGPLADPVALHACITTLLGKDEEPVLVDYATYNGVPSTILVLPDPDVGNKLDIYVEADSANCANQELTAVAFVPASAAP